MPQAIPNKHYRTYHRSIGLFRLDSNLKPSPTAMSSSSIPPIPTIGAPSSTSTAASLPTSSATLNTPTSDCFLLHTKTTYLVSANAAQSITRDVKFHIKYNSDFKLPHVLAMRTYRIEDCINAWASHAMNAQDALTACVAAVYKPDSGQPLTCWLKSTGPEGAMKCG